MRVDGRGAPASVNPGVSVNRVAWIKPAVSINWSAYRPKERLDDPEQSTERHMGKSAFLRRILSVGLAGAALSLPAIGASRTAAAAAAAAPSGSPYAGKVGLNTNLAALNEPAIERTLTTLRAGGVTMVREDLAWASVEPTRGQYDWTSLDNLMTAAADTGVDVLGILDYSAPWASSDPSGRGGKFYPPAQTSDFVAYAAAIADRYGAGGSFWTSHPELSARPLAAAEIWNEPWSSSYWMPQPDPARYLALARPTTAALHARGITVLVSGDLLEGHPGPSDTWLNSLLQLDPALNTWVDALSVHDYPSPRGAAPSSTSGNPLFRFDRLGIIQARVTAKLGAPMPIWVTEMGWSTTDAAGAVDEATQAQFLTQAARLAIDQFHVQKVFVYSWNAGGDGFGLRRGDGTPKPAWSAIESLLGS